MSEVIQNQETETVAAPMTIQYWIRLVGSILILVAVFLVAPRMMPEEINPPAYKETTLNAAQKEGRQVLLKGRTREAEKTTIATVGGKTTYTVGGQQLSERPEWLDENNQPTLTVEDKEKLARRYEFPAPAWMRYNNRRITYVEHNNIVTGVGFFGFLGLATSAALYRLFFWLFPGRRTRRDMPVVSLFWSALMAVFMGYLIPQSSVVTHLFWPFLLFGLPLAAMFLLWALTRSGKEEEAPEEPAEV